MSYKVLYRKYRPKDFENYCGQENIKNILINQLINDKISHAYLFSGSRGTGKTTTARIFAKTINCLSPKKGNPCEKCISCLSTAEDSDIIEIDAASNNGVEEIRNLRDNVKILPGFSKYKIYIIDEVHMLTPSAWNAFLKTLEEPPKHVIFIMATTEDQKIPITVLSRCQRFYFQKFSKEEIADNLIKISETESWNIETDAAKYIAELADGSMRDGLNILEQLATNKCTINVELIRKIYGLVNVEEIKNLFKSIFKNNILNIDEEINKITKNTIDINIILSSIISEIYNLIFDNNNKYEIEKLKNLALDVSELYNKKSGDKLLKIVLISFAVQNNKDKIISREIISDSNIKSLDVKKDIHKEVTLNKIVDDIINCRINNSFCEADKKLKKTIEKEWQNFIEKLDVSADKELLSIIEDTSIAVVSPTNILLYNNSKSTAMLFNEKLDEIEEKFSKYIGKKYKMICIEISLWEKEKEKYIKNKKKYNYISEKEFNKKMSITTNSDILNTVEEIFDEQLIEIN